MKKCLVIVRLICIAIIFTPALAEDNPNLRVLFVGNSLTYYNDVPWLVRQMSRSADQSVDIDVEMLAAGGASIAQHIQAGHLQRYLRDGDFHFVVFQDIGGWPICPPEFPGCAESIASIDKITELIRSVGAEPIWYSTYQRIPAMQTALSDKARQIAERLDIRLADVGAAWSYYEAIAGEGAPFLDDGHPIKVGSLIAAATILQVLASHIGTLEVDVGELCFREWQGTGLSEASLSSEQEPPDPRCEIITPQLQKRVIEAANHGFSPVADKAGTD